MLWLVEDDGCYDRVSILEVERRPCQEYRRVVAFVYSPAPAFVEPTDADREEMLATAREIVEAHNAKVTP